MWPLKKLLRDEIAPGDQWSAWQKPHQAALEAVITGAAPTQAMVAQAGGLESTCQLCRSAEGTYVHRAWHCQDMQQWRQQYGLPEALEDAARVGRRHLDMLLGRALMPTPITAAPAPESKHIRVWERRPPGGTFTGELYIDGSGVHPAIPQLDRAGWSVVQLTGAQVPVGILKGAVGGIVQCASAGEILAATMALRFGMPPITLNADYEGLVEGIAKGPHGTVRDNSVLAAVWKEFWAAYTDIGGDRVAVRKIKAHTSRRQLEMGESGLTYAQWWVNKQADKYDKQGARLHIPIDKTARRVRQERGFVKTVGQ